MPRCQWGKIMVPEIAAPVAAVGQYTAAEVVTIIAAVGVLIGSIVTGVVTVIGTLRNGQKTDKLSVAVIGNEKTPGLINQVAEVHTVVNSNLAALKAELNAATAQITSLIGTIRDLKSERDKLAERATMSAALSTEKEKSK